MPYYKVNAEVTGLTLPNGSVVGGGSVLFFQADDYTALAASIKAVLRQVNADGSPLNPYVPPAPYSNISIADNGDGTYTMVTS